MSHEDYNTILSQLMKLAETMLREQGAFVPFAAVMMADGTVEYVGIDPATLPPGTATEAIVDKLGEALTMLAGQHALRATVLFMDTRIALPETSDQKTDAIAAGLEHVDAPPLTALRPYLKTLSGDYEFSRLFATPGEARFLAKTH